jgi:hypothetical protein
MNLQVLIIPQRATRTGCKKNQAASSAAGAGGAGGAGGGGSRRDCSINNYLEDDFICDYFE